MDEFKIFALDFAKRAGQIMRDNFTLGMAKHRKEDSTPVTETDLKVNSLLIDEINSKFPGHRVLGEEKSSMGGSGKYVWVCDPVDGTIPFSHGIPISTFSLALTENGESILGVVYDPFQDRLFFANKGGGAYLNNKEIRVSQKSEIKESTAAYEMFKRARYDVNKLQERLGDENVKLMQLCSVVYASILVAAGELDFTIFPNTTPHDAAAVKIIVEEAGGRVTDIFGEDQRYDIDTKGFIASNGILHEGLTSLAKELVMDRQKTN